MNLLKIIFIILALGSAGCCVLAALNKRRNIGFILTSALVAAGDVICVFSLDIRDAKQALSVLLPHYIIHAWMIFSYLIMVVLTNRNKKYLIAAVPAGIICLYQTFLVVLQMRGARIFYPRTKFFFNEMFYVLGNDNGNESLFISFRAYWACSFIIVGLIVAGLVVYVRRTNKIFRLGYYAQLSTILGYAAFQVIALQFEFPIFLRSLFYNIITVIGLYYTIFFTTARLKTWSLNSFANDMTDGLLLYDLKGELIHENDMVRNTLGMELIDRFKTKENLEHWIISLLETEYDSIICYENNGKKRYFEVTVKDIGENDAYIGSLFILHDTTDSLVRIRAVEKANDELEKASKMKSDFLANMSHEIRTPMNAVIGMAEIAMREKDPSKIMESLLQIQNSGKNLLNIINDILDYSKIESGKMEILEEDYVPFSEFREIANVLFTRVGDKPIELYYILVGELPHMIRADCMRIRQIIINLANNAIKFTRQGMVMVNVIFAQMEDGMANMTVHVIDTGIGIKEEDMGKLFNSFQQLDSKRNREVEGTGLGLAISQKLVRAMGGDIGVASKYGEGSDFWFNVPVKVVDNTNDLVVTDADKKFAYGINEDEMTVDGFNNEMHNLGVESRVIKTIDEYKPTGKKEIFFIEEYHYDDKLKSFFASHPDAVGVMLVKPGFEPEISEKNVHLMHRPQSTMNMVDALNENFGIMRKVDEKRVFAPGFTAPDANILVVDDNAINLTIAEGLMMPLKVKLDKAEGGQKAIEMAAKKDYDIILMDHMMPIVDGVDATKAIRARTGDPNKPVIIALSANVIEEARKLFKESGMNDFVAKPIDIRMLTAKLKEWLPPEKVITKGELDFEEESSATEEHTSIDIDELDVEKAISGFGSAALFEKIAKEYYLSGNDKCNGILESFTNKDWEGYTIKVHALKSSSRQIGALALGDKAEALEKAGKAGDVETIMSDTSDLLESFKNLLSKMSPYFAEEESADKQEISKEGLESLLTELETACDDLDMDAMEEIGEKLKGYSFESSINESVKDLLSAIRDMDTDECMEIIGKIKGELE